MLQSTVCSALFAGVLISAGVSANAAEESALSQRFPILGAGTMTCEEWVTAEAGSTIHLAARSWILGMFSGYNVMGLNGRSFFFNYDEENLFESVRGQCERTPETLIADATEEFLTALTGYGFGNPLPPSE